MIALRYFRHLIGPLGILFCYASCTVVRNYPAERPFFFENTINITGEENKSIRAVVKNLLIEQIDDSAQIRMASKIPWPNFPWFIPSPILDQPVAYQRSYSNQSAINMRNLMASLGYRKNGVSFDTAHVRKKDQVRVVTHYTVQTGPLYSIDSVVYDFSDTALTAVAVSALDKAFVKKGTGLDYRLVDAEISRLTDLFQNNGYYKISKEDVIAEIDTNALSLLDASISPFELAIRLEELTHQRGIPRIHVQFGLRANRDTTHLVQYTIGKIKVIPDLMAEERDSVAVDSLPQDTDVAIISLHNTFHPNFIRSNISMVPGSLFKRDDYNKTIGNFNKMDVWQNINLLTESIDSSRLINYTLRMQPAKRQFFSIDLEGSSIINSSQMIQVGSGRVGLANNFTLRNRNIGKRAIQLENSLRTGIEFNNFKKILTGEISLSNRLTFPWMLAPIGDRWKSRFQQARTVVSADVSYIDRFRFFKLTSFNTSIGYEWRPNPNTSWQVKPINLEFTQFNPDSLFIESIKDFPLLLYTYNNGLIIGSNFLFNRNLNPGGTKHISFLKVYGEESGLLTGALFYKQTRSGKYLSNLYRFIKIDAEFKHVINYKKSSLNLRAFAGMGYAFSTASRKGQVTLPFFKSYTAGGPNSMRGWSLRKLGIGSNLFYDTVANGKFNDKYADIQLEANLEYRFNLFPFYGFWMRGAVFTDIGNIWFRNDLDQTLKNAGFRLDKLGRDLAIASGAGARVDFNYFLLRFDLGFPIKDPRYGPSNTGSNNALKYYSASEGGWFVRKVWSRPVFQFAIGYPF